MDRFITNVQVEDFLKDYTENSQTILLEEGKERNELEKIAKAKGMDIKNSRDLGIFKTIYAFSNKPNANGAILPKKELLRVLPQIIGKPVNINHNRNIVVGHYIDYKYLIKEDTVVAYGVYYKSYYEDLWNEAKKLFKSKKLSSSFEIWSPKTKRKGLSDGTYELRSMEIAGGALIYEDEDNQPAFKNAKMLMMAKEKTENNMELVYASKHKEDELIWVGKKEYAEVITTMPIVSKLKCSNCGEEFETAEMANIKCPKCLAILNKEGVMQYPPQVKDFKIMCPSCKVNNWLILSKTDNDAKLRCMGCTKEYNIAFLKTKIEGLADKLTFVYTGSTTCYQCHTRIPVESISKLNRRDTKCPKCGLRFSFDTAHETFKKISTIEEIRKDSIVKSSEKGGKPMDNKEIVAKASEKKVDKDEKPKVDDKKKKQSKEVPKSEKKVEEPKPVESPKVEKTPKAEVKEEKKEEPKVEVKKPEENVEVIDEGDINVDEVEKFIDEMEDDVEKAKEVDFNANNKFNCECIKCGYSKTSDNHCIDLKCPKCNGQMRRKERPGVGQPKGQRLTTEQRKRIPDELYAVVKIVKNKVTGKPRKIRMFPINDQAHVRNALARLAQPKVKAPLKQLGISVESVRRKIMKRARQLKMKSLIERHQTALKKAVAKIRTLRTELKITNNSASKKEILLKAGVNKAVKQYIDFKKQAEEKIEFYKANAQKVVERRNMVGEGLTDEELMNDYKFEIARLELENAKLQTSNEVADEIVGAKKIYSNIDTKKKEIDDVCFGRKK